MAETTHYSALGLTPTATELQIKQAYRRLAQKHHPDRGGDPAAFQKVTKAYETLIDPKQREKYDKTIGTGTLDRKLTTFFGGGFDV